MVVLLTAGIRISGKPSKLISPTDGLISSSTVGPSCVRLTVTSCVRLTVTTWREGIVRYT